MRNICKVIDQMLVLVPKDDPLIKRLEWLKKDSSYKAPEQMGSQWASGAIILSEEFKKAPSGLDGWQKDVYDIWINIPAQPA